MIDYKQMRKEIMKKSELLIKFDLYINSERFDNDIKDLIHPFLYDVMGLELIDEQLVLLKHEITSFIRKKYLLK